LGLMTHLNPKGLRGTTACQKTGGHREGVEGEPPGGPRDMEKHLDWLKPSFQLMQGHIRRKDARNRRHVLRRYPNAAVATSGIWNITQ
jgi:hypothetical protein